MEILFVIGRILYGGFFIMNGLNHFRQYGMLKGYAASKGVPAPGSAVMVTGLLILFGGLGVVLGIYIQWAVLALALFLIPVSLKMHNFWSVSDPMMRMAEAVNFSKNTALLGASLILLLIPEPWPYGVF